MCSLPVAKATGRLTLEKFQINLRIEIMKHIVRIFKTYPFVFFLVLSSTLSHGQWLKADGKKIVNSAGEEVLLKGYGPGGWQIMEGYMMQTSGFAGSQHEIKSKLIALMGEVNTETFFQKWRENHFTKRDVDSLAAWGFNSIRIPMHYNLFTLPIEQEPIPGENTWIETGFELIDSVLTWAAPYNMYVILDMHAVPGGQGTGSEINDYDPNKPSFWESSQNRDKLVALWTRIASRYKDNPSIGGYDLINEPHWDLGPGNVPLREIYERLTEGIRATGDEHILYIEGNWYANDHSGLTPPWDDNLVYSFHKYWSYNNANDLDWILPLREQHNVPLWMGESGENSNTWFTDAVSLFENNNIGWAWWAFRKIGDIDSPYAVKINPGYQKVISYWKGEGPQPSAQEAYDGMMQLVENLKVENSHFRKDVPDALIRQVQSDETLPYHGMPSIIPGIIYASDYDLGKNNYAYYDADVADYNLSTGEFQAWNKGWSYRNDGVDIEQNNEQLESNGYNIGFVSKGEWTKYTVQIEETGTYSVSIRLATQENGGEFYLSLDDEPITESKTVSSTGGWTKYTSLSIPDVLLTSGVHSLKLHFSNDIPVNITSISFENIGDSSEVPFKILKGITGTDENTIEITTSEPVEPISLEGAINQVFVLVNGTESLIAELNPHPTKARTFVLKLDSYLLSTDQIKVSYNGNTIVSETLKNLNQITDLEVENTLPKRFLVPGLLEVENYNFMQGFGLEDTTDEGGGQNFGYTDTGDFADYLIYVPTSGNYAVNFRIAGFNEGQIGLYTVSEDDQETELLIATTEITNGWQTWETISENAYLEGGIYKLRLRILSPGFNLNWIAFDAPDSDGDGVYDTYDLCPGTPENTLVDVNGCEIFSFPAENFLITISSETCREANDGKIKIEALVNLDYSLSLSANDFFETRTFTNQVEFENLSAGTYTACISLIQNSDVEQCFTLVVSEPQELDVSVNLSGKNDNSGIISPQMHLTLTGGKLYYITLNGKTTVTEKDEINLELDSGMNSLEVTTEKLCQGIFTKTIHLNQIPILYPNPIVNDRVEILLNDFVTEDVFVKIFEISGRLLFSQSFVNPKDSIFIDVSDLSNGIFLLQLNSNNRVINYKFLK